MRPTEARVYLEAPSARRERDYLDACHRSRALHRGLVAPAPGRARYAEFLDRAGRPDRRSFFVIAAATSEIAGVVEILDMLPEPALAGRLAYYAFLPHAGTGLMCEGVRLVVDAAFCDLGLARLAADIEPGNRRSRALARRLGFRCDQARRVSLKIGTRWRDHERWLLERADWPGAVTTPTCARS